MSTSDEVGRTVRVALRGWSQTLRLCVIIMVMAAAAAVACLVASRWHALVADTPRHVPSVGYGSSPVETPLNGPVSQ